MESKLYKRVKDHNIKECLIIGDSNYGPTNAIVKINNINDVINIFGDEGSLYHSYEQIKDVIPENVGINMIKPTGTHSFANFNVNVLNDTISINALTLSSIYSNEIYNETLIKVLEDKIEFVFPEFFNIPNANYYYKDYEVLGQLLDAINTDTYNSKNIVIATTTINEYTPFDESFYAINESKNLEGGKSGLYETPDNLYKALEKTYDIILGEEIYTLILTNAYMDDEVTYKYSDNRLCTFYEQLLRFNIKQLNFGYVTEGFITFSNRIKNDEDLVRQVKYYIDITKNELLDNHRFLVSITYGELFYDYKTKFSNALMFYAMLYMRLEFGKTTTNKFIDNSYSIKDYLTYLDIKSLTDLGVVTFRHSPLYDKVVACNGVTSVTTNNELKYIVNVSMIQNIMPSIKQQLEKYLGENIKTVIESSLIKEDIKKHLIQFQNKGIIQNFNFVLTPNYELGELICNLSIKSAYMVEQIKIIGKIKFEQLEEI